MIRLFLLALAVAALWQAEPLHLSIQARSVRPGEVVVLTIDGASAGDVKVHAFGMEIPAYRDGAQWRAVIGIDLDVKPGAYAVRVESRATVGTETLHVEPRTFRTRRLTVNEAFVTPPASEQARIDREAALLVQTWAASANTRLWSSPFERPVPQEANSAFGTRSIFNGKPRNPHGGADFLSPAGTTIRAPNAGRVAVAQNLYYSGNTVIIDHGLGLFSTLAHLSRIDAREGDRVQAKQPIGLVGATGRVTGPHLHWAVRANDARVDPLSLLATLGAR